MKQVIRQTRARVWDGDTHYREKLFSLFEPHTEAIRKGKAAKPTEFGKLVKIQEAERGLVIDYEVYAHRPADKALRRPAITDTVARPSRSPRPAEPLLLPAGIILDPRN